MPRVLALAVACLWLVLPSVSEAQDYRSTNPNGTFVDWNPLVSCDGAQ